MQNLFTEDRHEQSLNEKFVHQMPWPTFHLSNEKVYFKTYI